MTFGEIPAAVRSASSSAGRPPHVRFHVELAGTTAEAGLWRSESRVADLFQGHTKLVAELLAVPSGVGEVIHGQCAIDLATFNTFCAAALAQYGETEQGIERALTVGFIATALVLLDRAGRPLPASVAPGQQAAWAALRDQHAAVMPR